MKNIWKKPKVSEVILKDRKTNGVTAKPIFIKNVPVAKPTCVCQNKKALTLRFAQNVVKNLK